MEQTQTNLDPSPTLGQQHKSITFALVAGEVSGDLLGAELIKSLRKRYPYAKFIGIGGERMIDQGMESFYPIDTLSVMGLWAVLQRLPQLLHLRSELFKTILRYQPKVFIGIDAPDFNLGLARRLKESHIPTIHYVSPSVWAWRRRRVLTIDRSVDLMLTLFPFERSFYLNHGVAAEYVGHPAADDVPIKDQTDQYRDQLSVLLGSNISKNQSIIAVLPGSRSAEIQYIGPVFLKTIQWVDSKKPGVSYVIPCASEKRMHQIQALIDHEPGLQQIDIQLLLGKSKVVMGASNGVLLASGTATLEALLLKKPMVVAYKWHWLTHFIISKMVNISQFALPNILAGEALVPEFIQDNARVETIGPALLSLIHGQNNEGIIERFTKIHEDLAQGASDKAALAIEHFLGVHKS